MNSVERVHRVMRGEAPDRLPVYDLLRNDAVIEHYAGERLSLDNRQEVVYRAIGAALDATKQFIRLPEEPRTEVGPDGRRRVYERWTIWVAPLPIRAADDVTAYLRRVLDAPEQYLPDPAQRAAEIETDFRAKRKALGDVALFMDPNATEGFHDLYELIGLDWICYLITDATDLLAAYLDLLVAHSQQIIAHLTVGTETPGVFYGCDIAHKTATIFSPSFLRRVLFPRMEALVDAYHCQGFKVMFHSDGNLMAVLDDLVTLGFDALNPLETLAGMDPGEIRRRHPNLVLVGGMDCSQLLPYGTPAQVRAEVRRLAHLAGPRLLIGSSSEVHNQVPLDNYRAMIEEARQFLYG